MFYAPLLTYPSHKMEAEEGGEIQKTSLDEIKESFETFYKYKKQVETMQ
jgi:hypothetical protein